MSTHDKKQGTTLTLVEAVETLSSIADLQFDHEAEIAQRHDVSAKDKPLTAHTVHWLRHQGSSVTMPMIKEVFRVILQHLRDFHKNKNKHDYIGDVNTESNVKTIMVLVGEAAQKMDRYTKFFHKNRVRSIKELKEYKELQDFYLTKIARQIDAGTIGKWILALAHKGSTETEVELKGVDPRQAKHVFIDLEAVQKDSEYELFFLKKEDGTRFFSPRLIRNIKLVSGFGSSIGEEKEEAFAIAMEEWQDKIACVCAKNMMQATRGYIEKFYRFSMQSKDHELVELLHKSLIALMMAGNPRHLLRHSIETKTCRDYFYDFQQFLRHCLRSSDYQKLMAYSPDKSQKLGCAMTNLIHFLCMALYTQLTGYQECLSGLTSMLSRATDRLSVEHKQQAVEKENRLWCKLAMDYEAMAKWLKGYAGGPLNRILADLENGDCHQFDPILQGNLPSLLYTLYAQENRYQFARWPSPTYQAFVHKAAVNDEFKGFLYACEKGHTAHRLLFFNFQDRVSWKEHFRCRAIEDLVNYESFARHIDVVTMSKDTEFYLQQAPYRDENHADVFIANFKKQFDDPAGGFLLPQKLKHELLQEFIPGALETIHRVFFSGANVLLVEDRLNFIEIFYMLLELKIIESLKPDIVGFSCKDGLDVTCAAAGELFLFLKLLSQERLSENDQEHLDLILYGPCWLSRERVMIPERFHRMLNVIKLIEQVRSQYGQGGFAKVIQESFRRLYKTPILQGKTVVQRNKDIL